MQEGITSHDSSCLSDACLVHPSVRMRMWHSTCCSRSWGYRLGRIGGLVAIPHPMCLHPVRRPLTLKVSMMTPLICSCISTASLQAQKSAQLLDTKARHWVQVWESDTRCPSLWRSVYCQCRFCFLFPAHSWSPDLSVTSDIARFFDAWGR